LVQEKEKNMWFGWCTAYATQHKIEDARV